MSSDIAKSAEEAKNLESASDFSTKLQNWDKNTVRSYEDNVNEAREMMKQAVKMLNKRIEVKELLAIMKLFSAFQLGDDRFYTRMHNIALYKLQVMQPAEVVSSFISMSLISLQPDLKTSFDKFFNIASYKILKSMHSLNSNQIANVVYSLGKTKQANKRVLKSYKQIISKKIFDFSPDHCHKVLIGWIQSGQFISDDQEFLNRLLSKVVESISELRSEQITKLYYNLYGKSLASLEFKYFPEIEQEIYNRSEELDFVQIVQVLSTFKFMEKKVEDPRIEAALEKNLEKLVPKEIHYLLRYFYNDKVDMGFSKRIQERLEEIVRTDAPEMNPDELSITYTSLALAKKSSPKLLEYLEGNLAQNEKEYTLDSIIHLLNLKLQGSAEFLDLEKVAAPTTLKLLRQRNFTPKQYTTLVIMFTAMKYYDEAFWREVLGYLKDVELPDAISYMQLHSSLSVVRQQIDIEQEMKLLPE